MSAPAQDISTPIVASSDDGEAARVWSSGGSIFTAQKLLPGLHIVATPIGNLGDITLRGLATLAAADMILAEDTRMARRLTDHYGIKTPTRRFDAHASAAQTAIIMAELTAGAAYALISDAGTPLVSDPGSTLVVQLVQAGITVHPVPGASALLAALVVAGMPADRFFFEGFLPPKTGDRRRRLRALAGVPGALVFYEAPHRILETLVDLQAILGNRHAAAARELTKLYETVIRGPLRDITAHFEKEAPRGEFVLVISPPAEAVEENGADLDEQLTALMQQMSVKDAAAVIAGEQGLPKREVYARALRIASKTQLRDKAE
ncbi:MAG: 16S rRNA (cytidine(1402)-2'-O)-methyltransferase [Beijerinckiaceae bacterium]